MKQKVTGNLVTLALAGKFDVVVHGCNCQHVMGAGVAKQLAQAFPAVVEADLQTTKGVEKLGTVSYAFPTLANGETLIVANAYMQAYYGKYHHAFNYDALRSCFEQIKRDLEGLHIAYPAIGAGLGLGDWRFIQPIIDEVLEGETHTFVSLPQTNLTGSST